MVVLFLLFAQTQDPTRDWAPRSDDPDRQVRKTQHEIDRETRRKPDGKGGFRESHTGFEVHVLPDGVVRFTDRKARWKGLVATFDITEWAMRLRGEDPYSYEKNKFLAATREERLGMARKDRTERIAAALRDLPRMLSAIAASADLTPADRRRILFLLWDDCLEAGEPDLVRASTDARETIVRFVRNALPAGSTLGYDEDELRRLNAARKSKARFGPYAAPAEVPVPSLPGRR